MLTLDFAFYQGLPCTGILGAKAGVGGSRGEFLAKKHSGRTTRMRFVVTVLVCSLCTCATGFELPMTEGIVWSEGFESYEVGELDAGTQGWVIRKGGPASSVSIVGTEDGKCLQLVDDSSHGGTPMEDYAAIRRFAPVSGDCRVTVRMKFGRGPAGGASDDHGINIGGPGGRGICLFAKYPYLRTPSWVDLPTPCQFERDEWFELEFVPDFEGHTIEVFKDGQSYGRVKMGAGVQSLDYISLRSQRYAQGTLWVDDIEVVGQVPAPLSGQGSAEFRRARDDVLAGKAVPSRWYPDDRAGAWNIRKRRLTLNVESGGWSAARVALSSDLTHAPALLLDVLKLDKGVRWSLAARAIGEVEGGWQMAILGSDDTGLTSCDLSRLRKDQPRAVELVLCAQGDGELQMSTPQWGTMSPKLLEPGHNEQRVVIVGPGGDELRWQPQADAGEYTLEIWPAGGDKQTVRTDRPYWQPEANLKPGLWHWRVRARSEGTPSGWSEQWTFRQGNLRKLNAGAVKHESTTLRVQERAGVTRDNSPVTSGLPFPEGAIFSADNLRLEDEAGQESPLQAIVTSRWPDGSIRWALLDFQVSLAAGETQTLILHYGTDVTRTKLPDMVVATPSALEAAQLAIEDESGNYVCHLFDHAPQIEVAGPLHSVALYQSDMLDADGNGRYRLLGRLHLYAEREHCRLELTFVNEHLETLRNISRIELRLPSEFAAQRYTVGGDGDAIIEGDLLDEGVRLRQDGPTVYDKNPIKWELSTGQSGEQASGWAHIQGDGSLTVAVRRMAQLHPKVLSMDAEGITVQLWPSDHEPYECGQGTAKTHELLIAWDTETPEAARDAGLGFCTPLFAVASPEWYCTSGAFGDIIPRNPQMFPQYERWIDGMIDNHAQIHRNKGEWGMRDFGDWDYSSRYERGWGNIEYDTCYTTALQFARSGDLRWLDETEVAAQHYADIDCCHWASDGNAGWPHVHYTDHWRAGNDLGHTWLQGLIYDYLLTGNRWSYEVGLDVGNFCAQVGFDMNITNRQERGVGWMLICLMEVYKLTGAQRYLDAATNIVDQAYDWQDKEIGYLPHPIDRSECKCETQCVGGKSFMMGVVLEGMWAYYEVTGSQKAREIIERGAHWLADYMWVEADKGYKYSSCKAQTSGRNGDLMELMGMGHAWELTGREDYLLQPLKQLAEYGEHLPDQISGGISAAHTRASVMFLSVVSRALGSGWQHWAREGKLPPDVGKPQQRAEVRVRAPRANRGG